MFSSLWIKLVIPLLLIALIVMGSCRMMKMLGWNKRQPRPPKIVTTEPLTVLRAESGSRLIVEDGRGRRKYERIVDLKGIVSPAPGSRWESVSRDHLKEMAGPTVTVQYERHGLRAEAPSDSPQDSEEVGREITDKEFDEEFGAWMDEHTKSCKQCGDSFAKEPGPICEEAFAKMQEIMRRGRIESTCYACNGKGCILCSGDGKLWLTPETIEARGPLVGTVFGSSGILLQRAQLEAGMVTCQPDAPKEWAKAESMAKKQKRGIWSKEK